MKIYLVQAYVALKAAKNDPIFAEMQEKMSRKEFITQVMNRPLTELPREIRQQCQTNITQRYGLNRRPRLFPKPTIGQWIANVTGVYSAEDILAFFSQSSSCPLERFKQAKIGDQTISRPYLIDLVEKLEVATGRTLTLPEGDKPLEYLRDSVTYKEVAKYFTASSESISRLRRQYCRGTRFESMVDTMERFRDSALRAYRITAEVDDNVSDKELLSRKVREFHPAEYAETDWELPIFWAEEILKIQLSLKSFTENTTVGELIDLMVAAQKYELERK